MIDSGATGLFLHQKFVNQHRIVTQPLPHPIALFNIDGTRNLAGEITHSARLLSTIDGNPAQLLEYLITNLGSEDIILGLHWLRRVNPHINWKDGKLRMHEPAPRSVTIEELPEPQASNIGGTTQPDEPTLMANPEFLPLPSPDNDELTLPIEESEDQTPLYRLVGN